MAFSPTIACEIQRQVEQTNGCRGRAAWWGSAWAAGYIRDHGLKIEALAAGDESPAALRGRLEAAYAAYAPETPGDVALVEQVVTSTLEAERCRRLQAQLRTEKRRTALLRWEWEQEDYVRNHLYMLETSPYEAFPLLKRTAAGCRYLAQEWRRLAAVLKAEGTWYQHDCVKAIMYQGHSAVVENLYFSEPAYLTLLHCVGTMPRPKQFDIDLVLDPKVMPKPIADRGESVWPPDRAASRAYLEAIVARELPEVEALEAKLAVEYEEPARAAAQARDEAEPSRHEARLMRDLRSHERAARLAHQALMRRKPRRV